MNIERLVAAAKAIDRKAALQEERSTRFQELASMARKAHESGDKRELQKIQTESRHLSCTVVDFGDAINELRRALKARAKK